MYLARSSNSARPQAMLHSPAHPYTQALISAMPVPERRPARRRQDRAQAIFQARSIRPRAAAFIRVARSRQERCKAGTTGTASNCRRPQCRLPLSAFNVAAAPAVAGPFCPSSEVSHDAFADLFLAPFPTSGTGGTLGATVVAFVGEDLRLGESLATVLTGLSPIHRPRCRRWWVPRQGR